MGARSNTIRTISSARQQARLLIVRQHEKLGSWAKVAADYKQRSGLHFDRSTYSKIARGQRDAPRGLLQALGIPFAETGPGRVCSVHGVVHDKQCQPKRYRRLADMPAALLAWRIEQREEM